MIWRYLPATASALLLAACTSFRGVPEPVVTTAQAQLLIQDKLPDAVVRNMKDMSPDERTVERNRVVSSYLMAADAKYDQFRGDISQNVKGSNIAFDLATLGLTGLASRIKDSAQSLSAAATVVGGARASLNHELYFERTLPTLLSLMDSSRLAVRAEILKGLAKPETQYTIEDAFSDIWRYQAAASIDGAIQQAAAAAAQKADAAAIDYSKAVDYCSVPEAVADQRILIMRSIEAAASGTDGPKLLQAAAQAAGMADAPLATNADQSGEQLDKIGDYVLALCSADQVANFRQRLTQAGVSIGG